MSNVNAERKVQHTSFSIYNIISMYFEWPKDLAQNHNTPSFLIARNVLILLAVLITITKLKTRVVAEYILY